MKTRIIIIVLAIALAPMASQAQILALTISAISKSLQPGDKKLMSNIKGEWIIDEARIDRKNVIEEFDGVKITFPKCKGKAYKAGECQVIEVEGDDKTDYFKELFTEESKAEITSRKEIYKAGRAEDADFEKVKYELVQVKGVEYEFSFMYKKGTLRIATLGVNRKEYFQLVRPPKEKKKKR